MILARTSFIVRGVSAADVGSDPIRPVAAPDEGKVLEAGRRPGLILYSMGDELAGMEAPR